MINHHYNQFLGVGKKNQKKFKDSKLPPILSLSISKNEQLNGTGSAGKGRHPPTFGRLNNLVAWLRNLLNEEQKTRDMQLNC